MKCQEFGYALFPIVMKKTPTNTTNQNLCKRILFFFSLFFFP